MKLKLALIGSVFFSALGMASSTVCAGEKIYSSDVQNDFGVQPPSGAHLGSHIILYDRAVLLNYDRYQGLHLQGVPPYRIQFEGDQTILTEGNNPGQIVKVFSVEAVVLKVDSISHKVLKEVGRENVVCRLEQNLVP